MSDINILGTPESNCLEVSYKQAVPSKGQSTTISLVFSERQRHDIFILLSCHLYIHSQTIPPEDDYTTFLGSSIVLSLSYAFSQHRFHSIRNVSAWFPTTSSTPLFFFFVETVHANSFGHLLNHQKLNLRIANPKRHGHIKFITIVLEYIIYCTTLCVHSGYNVWRFISTRKINIRQVKSYKFIFYLCFQVEK